MAKGMTTDVYPEITCKPLQDLEQVQVDLLSMPHSFFPSPGFLLGGTAPLREAFLMVGAAADWCSLEPRCRGFTISAEVHDDRLHWVRFSSNGRVVLSAEWMSYF